ncbi:MAG: hypothetical protein OXU86_05470 [Thaumarchaeota archaeon]|nr:hypothetical protein [Nitrososphaerota archaeon]
MDRSIARAIANRPTMPYAIPVITAHSGREANALDCSSPPP